MCFKVTFTHCPHCGHRACQQRQSDACWQPKHIAYAHTSIVSHMFFLVGLFFLFYIIIMGICCLYRNWLAESHSQHSMYFAVIPAPPVNLTYVFSYGHNRDESHLF